jgi:SAM-dependent methyltransferase
MVEIPPTVDAGRRFRESYTAHRLDEGRGAGGVDELLALPYLRKGPLARQWTVRARTFDVFVRRVLPPCARRLGRSSLTVLDLGSGPGWLSARLAQDGHRAVALDFRRDPVDGLRASESYRERGRARFGCIQASFEHLPIAPASFDVAVFNASLHYALSLRQALVETHRVVRPGGSIAILDTPFYRAGATGEAMVGEKRANARVTFGERAGVLMGLPMVEFLTASRLAEASEHVGLSWRRRRVRYPLWYELRPLLAVVRGRRTPSRFDIWEAVVP